MFIIQPLKLVLESYKWRVLNNNVHYLILFRVFMVLLFILSFLLFELLDKCLLQLIIKVLIVLIDGGVKCEFHNVGSILHLIHQTEQ